MKLSGQINEITDINKFVAGFANSKPPPGSFKPMANARVSLAVFEQVLGADLVHNPFFANFSVSADADGAGRFSFNQWPFAAKTPAFLSVYRQSKLFGPFPAFKVFLPEYRSASFTVSQGTTTLPPIFIFPFTAPTASGITQETVNAHISRRRKKATSSWRASAVGSVMGAFTCREKAKGRKLYLTSASSRPPVRASTASCLRR